MDNDSLIGEARRRLDDQNFVTSGETWEDLVAEIVEYLERDGWCRVSGMVLFYLSSVEIDRSQEELKKRLATVGLEDSLFWKMLDEWDAIEIRVKEEGHGHGDCGMSGG